MRIVNSVDVISNNSKRLFFNAKRCRDVRAYRSIKRFAHDYSLDRRAVASAERGEGMRSCEAIKLAERYAEISSCAPATFLHVQQPSDLNQIRKRFWDLTVGCFIEPRIDRLSQPIQLCIHPDIRWTVRSTMQKTPISNGKSALPGIEGEQTFVGKDAYMELLENMRRLFVIDSTSVGNGRDLFGTTGTACSRFNLRTILRKSNRATEEQIFGQFVFKDGLVFSATNTFSGRWVN